MDTKIVDDKILELNRKMMELLIPKELPAGLKNSLIDWIQFRRELTNESDRGCALLAASHIDYLLEEALKSKLIGSKNEFNTLFDFNGPLGNFSSRISISYSIGLITKEEKLDLQIIRSIRNKFGHSPIAINFESPDVSSLCNNLRLKNKYKQNNRETFLTSVSLVTGTLFAIPYSGDKICEKHDNNFDKIVSYVKEFREFLGFDK